MIKSTNVRNLSRNFSAIRRDLQSGITYMLVYRSIPIAKITPIDVQDLIAQEANEKTTIKASLIDFVT